MSQIQINKADLTEYELISIEGEPRKATSIRRELFRRNIAPEVKALIRGGSEAVRAYYNGKNQRRKLGNWNCSNTKFTPNITLMASKKSDLSENEKELLEELKTLEKPKVSKKTKKAKKPKKELKKKTKKELSEIAMRAVQTRRAKHPEWGAKKEKKDK